MLSRNLGIELRSEEKRPLEKKTGLPLGWYSISISSCWEWSVSAPAGVHGSRPGNSHPPCQVSSTILYYPFRKRKPEATTPRGGWLVSTGEKCLESPLREEEEESAPPPRHEVPAFGEIPGRGGGGTGSEYSVFLLFAPAFLLQKLNLFNIQKNINKRSG